MTKRRGSKKGTPFERELARRLSLWWSQDWPEGPSDNLIWRTSQSGGRATSRSKAGKDSRVHCSDLCAIDPRIDPLFRAAVVELKKGYLKDTIHDMLDRPIRAKQQEYEGWLEKIEIDKARAGALYWMLIHMRDRREPIIYMPQTMMNSLMSYGAMEEDAPHICMTVYKPCEQTFCGTPLAAFLTGTKPCHILTLLAEDQQEDET